MAPDTIPHLLFISGSFGAEDGGNVLWLKTFRCSDFTGTTLAFFHQFRELAWIDVGLFSLTLCSGRAAIIQEGCTRNPDNGS